jgi:uncharacterized protein YciI
MGNKIHNEKAIDIFVIIAETLEKWQNPSTDAGKAVLGEHYNWAAELKAENKIILAGPVDFELTSTNKINPIGHTTGIIMLNVSSREEAIAWAEKDPFHMHGYRKNIVHSLKISITENAVFETLYKLNNSA